MPNYVLSDFVHLLTCIQITTFRKWFLFPSSCECLQVDITYNKGHNIKEIFSPEDGNRIYFRNVAAWIQRRRKKKRRETVTTTMLHHRKKRLDFTLLAGLHVSLDLCSRLGDKNLFFLWLILITRLLHSAHDVRCCDSSISI